MIYHDVIPYHTIPFHTIPYHTMSCHDMPYRTIPYHTIPYHTISGFKLLYGIFPAHKVGDNPTSYYQRDYVTMPHPDASCPIPDVDYLCLLCIDFYVWDAVSIFNHLPRMILSTDFAFRITDWTCCHGPHLHAILRIISRGVSGLATDFPCGVWGRGWTTCLLHDSPLFGSHFKMRVGM